MSTTPTTHPHHETRIREAVEAAAAEHGPVVRVSCSSVWSFGAVFADGHRTRFVVPRGLDLDAARAWVRALVA